MGIQSDAQNFSVKFIQISDSFISSRIIDKFFETREELNMLEDADIPTIKENITLKLQFYSDDPETKFFMDGLDVLEFNNFDVDLSKRYFLPQKNDITLFKYGEDPMVPGYFEIRVVFKDKTYYSRIEIEPTLLAKKEWMILKDDLNACINGLAEDFIRRNISIGMNEKEKSYISVGLLQKFIIIERYSLQLIAALQDLYLKVNYKIIEEYKLTPTEKARRIDAKTIRYQQIHSENIDKVYAPIKKITYNLPENRYLKRTLVEIKNILKKVKVASYAYQNIIKNEIQEMQEFHNSNKSILNKQNSLQIVEKNIQKAKSIYGFIEMIENTVWYDEINVDSRHYIETVPQLVLDSRYGVLYQLNRALKRKNLKYIIDEQYTYQYKRTDKLYEMWCFLKIHRILMEELEFMPIKGWMYDADYNSEDILIPMLLPNTIIEYKKDEIVLQLTYDGVIPDKSSETKLMSMPVYIKNQHNRPDARLDVYNEKIYIGSVMIDCKYRKPNRFWKNQSKPKDYLKEMHQFLAYKDCESKYLYGSDRYRGRMRPVNEVWALYPLDENTTNDRYYKDERLRLLKVCPGKENNLLEVISNNIKEMINDYIRT